jgi:phosphopantothenoylcysteine decarboxylase
MKILLGLSGSVASIKALELFEALSCGGQHEVKIVATEKALHFTPNLSSSLPVGALITDADEWSSWEKMGDPVVHIELRRWADLFVIAPCSANTLAKIAYGLSDNAVTCTVRCWKPKEKPLLIAPAMNTAMWENEVTGEHLERARKFGATIIDPVVKTLACGDTGQGAMASIPTIVDHVKLKLQ